MTIRIDSVEHPVLAVADIERTTPMADVLAHLETCGVAPIEGRVRRTGAVRALESVSFHDPDENLVEVANPLVEDRS